ncbi:unnamed protein product [Discosporangium mesarthrocarpum]
MDCTLCGCSGDREQKQQELIPLEHTVESRLGPWRGGHATMTSWSSTQRHENGLTMCRQEFALHPAGGILPPLSSTAARESTWCMPLLLPMPQPLPRWLMTVPQRCPNHIQGRGWRRGPSPSAAMLTAEKGPGGAGEEAVRGIVAGASTTTGKGRGRGRDITREIGRGRERPGRRKEFKGVGGATCQGNCSLLGGQALIPSGTWRWCTRSYGPSTLTAESGPVSRMGKRAEEAPPPCSV